MRDIIREKKETLKKIEAAIKKHRDLARWGNVESRERLKFLRQQKKEITAEIG